MGRLGGMMRRILTILVIGAALGLAWLWLVPGFSVLIGGPDRSSIVTATRAALAGPPGTTMPGDVAAIRPIGLCNKAADGSFACAVEIMSGDSTETVVTVLSKDASGAWVARP